MITVAACGPRCCSCGNTTGPPLGKIAHRSPGGAAAPTHAGRGGPQALPGRQPAAHGHIPARAGPGVPHDTTHASSSTLTESAIFWRGGLRLPAGLGGLPASSGVYRVLDITVVTPWANTVRMAASGQVDDSEQMEPRPSMTSSQVQRTGLPCTILFVDVCGSTKLYETLGNARAQAIIAKTLAILSRAARPATSAPSSRPSAMR